jgi:hypothetical protein
MGAERELRSIVTGFDVAPGGLLELGRSQLPGKSGHAPSGRLGSAVSGELIDHPVRAA